MSSNPLHDSLELVLQQYAQSFAHKVFLGESSEEDDLMLVFGLTQEMKAGNKQYWGRELGMCWQRLVSQLCRQACNNWTPPIREGSDELCDVVVGTEAIDTKYRIGSGDSGTLKKFKQYGARLRDLGYAPILLILRTDNLPAAITACTTGGWRVITGDDSYQYLLDLTSFDMKAWLLERHHRYAPKLST